MRTLPIRFDVSDGEISSIPQVSKQFLSCAAKHTSARKASLTNVYTIHTSEFYCIV